MVDSSSSQESIILPLLLGHLEKAKLILAKGSIKHGHVKMWNTAVNRQIQRIYGAEHVISKSLSPQSIPEGVDFGDELKKRMFRLERFIESLERSGSNIFLGKNEGSRIFIGHGRSPMWRELKDFLNDRLGLPWDEFNREVVAGINTFDRISEMLDSACFAFLIMTAEDQYSDSSTHARQNVVHEVGLFQGRLGPKKAIILLEDGCSEFSNIVGLSQIQFPRGRISAAFEEIRRVLEREGVIKT